ncbi:MBL fold metallo-hydrolase [Paludibacterium yongneupense]|nr:MBL fold metallo-hydrolase [Paludibacterium yongneupense]
MTTPHTSKTYHIGDARVTRVTETHLTGLTPSFLYADWDATLLDTYPPLRSNLDGTGEHAIISIHTWVVELAGQTILIDTGIGNHKERPFSQMFHGLNTPFLQRLEAAGVRPDDVDHVLLTHLHADHVGWNTHLVDGRWLATFRNARYVLPQGEVDYFGTPASANRRIVFDDSVAPVIEAGQAVTIGLEGGDYLDGFHFHPTPGHSAGHMSISLTSRGETAIFSGDVMHSPVQVYRPTWNSVFCAEQERARESRRWLLEFAATNRAAVFTAHFPQSSAGLVQHTGDDLAWRYL